MRFPKRVPVYLLFPPSPRQQRALGQVLAGRASSILGLRAVRFVRFHLALALTLGLAFTLALALAQALTNQGS